MMEDRHVGVEDVDQKSTQSLHDRDLHGRDLEEPYEGMEFDSEEAAKVFYSTYARHVGFRIRISRYTRSRRDNSVISRRIVCSKEGFREDRPGQGGLFAERRHRQRAATRVGCKAMIMVKKIGSGKWVAAKFVKEHNHGPVPPRKVEARVVDEPIEKLAIISNGDAIEEPIEGMEFDSEEAAKLYYNAYARHTGFRARISKYCRSRRDDSIISRQIVCSKEGFREIRVKKEESDESRAAKRPRMITRIGCKAMIIVKKISTGKWVVSKFEREHNHALVNLKNAPPLLQSLHASNDKISCHETPQGASLETLTVLYNQLCCEAIRYAQEGATTVETYNVAMAALREAMEKVAAAKRGALTVAQPTFLVSGANQGETIPQFQGGNSFIIPAKALEELQCSNEIKEALAGKELILLQQPVNFVLVPSTKANELDATKAVCSTLNEIQPLPPSPSGEGIPANGSEDCDLLAGRKRELQMIDGDVEGDAVQKSQKLENVRFRRTKTAPSSSSNLSSPGLSETQVVAVPAFPVTLYMHARSLPEACSGTSPVEAWSDHHGEAGAESHAGSHQRAQKASLSPNPLPGRAKPYTRPNPQVHATAIAAGARVVPPEAAASLIQAIEARIRSTRALAQPEDPRLEFQNHSVVGDVGETQMELVEASGGC